MIQTDRLYSADDLYTIREYAARFSHEYSRCPETDDRAAFGAFKSGLRASQFRYLPFGNHGTTPDTYLRPLSASSDHCSDPLPNGTPRTRKLRLRGQAEGLVPGTAGRHKAQQGVR
ncbi:unnamed protein product [Prunus brigantina]